MFDCFADFENIESIVAVVAELEFGDVENWVVKMADPGYA